MLKIPFILFSLLLPALASAAGPDAHLALLPAGAEASLLVTDAKTGKTVYSHDAETLRPPASVQKVITALAARLQLGNEYRFNTDIETEGNDVIFRFNGDPSLRRDDIRRLVASLKRETSIIRGNVYLNGAAFDDFELADGLPWDNLGICYSAPSSSISLDDNCAVAKMVFTDNNNTQIDFQVSRDAPINIVEKLELTDGLEKRYCKFKLMADNTNQYTLGGCLGRHKIPRFLSFAIQNTELYVAEIIRRELKHAGIELQGDVIRNDRASGRIIARHESAALPELLDEMLKDSDNLIADNLLKAVGRSYYDEPGSFDNGVSAVKAVLQEKAGIDLAHAALADGSGLSRNNRMTATQIMAVMQYIYAHPELKLMDAMAEAGKSGTLRYRYSLRGDTFKGRVRGKTGTLYGTYNIAGMMSTASGSALLFVQMVTNYHHPDYHRHEKREIRNFEKKFYQSLYSMK
ncbi:D-alanyl-D-alanine carboxypeptidase/D-alanyl-D-alanine-endopeptidase [Methylophaga sp.]|jgi:D-alanyl-D-alanine carboxypeptidase/D-alanyl-D-alanine-endopeptidase (penicillin-binding protein 4)|uniref:D-alanyl-D-alanine carboxypeptidase/D-alanyl-D-alanine endopeptidase n=1 Tax=Methylophaga sp. TaxID=2024840 RepID=UPI001401AE97|nr:D-alanyl-D-alanine carboxypeptidase/D-alanyl-D-alanine-endopeptidase [Methylophaga sp.]MTI64821.1 D-alanyl-D-alanine carboxypeptidase/D-alanyl-D-alanine-endopeptidase [Methylophaga sp.]